MVWTRNRPLGLTHRDPEKTQAGYTLFASVRGPCATLLDHQGRVVHRWRLEEGIQYASLLPSGRLLVRTLPPLDAGGAERIGGSSAALVELDWDGEVLWRYDEPFLHHDCLRLDSGNTVIAVWRKLPEGLTERVLGGSPHPEDPERMWGDVLQEITPDGRCVWEWRSWEHLEVEAQVKCPLEDRREWTHMNSVRPGPGDDLLVSFRLTDTVALLDRKSGALKWSWGPGVLSHQHHATWLSGSGVDDGRVLIFDNGCHRKHGPAYSRVVEVDTASGEIVWSYQDPTVLAFFSFMVSGAERLPDGNTLITEGATGRIFEVTSRHEVVWEYVSPFVYDSNFGPTPSIFRAHRYAADDPRFEGRELDPERYGELNDTIARNEFPNDPPSETMLLLMEAARAAKREREERERAARKGA
ncbi:MAG: aryl-sulfate sulfotransferase [Myxococcales bacterium]|nr:aryl-sulfate sulfotransferase [Myxococcales bacterium]